MNNTNSQYNPTESSIRNMEMNKSNSSKNIESESSSSSRGSMFLNKVVLPPLAQQLTNQHIIQPHASTYRYPQNSSTTESPLWSIVNKQRPVETNNVFTNYPGSMDDSLAAARLVVNFSNTQQPHGFHNSSSNLPSMGTFAPTGYNRQDAIPRPDTAANEGKLNNVMVQERENNGVKDKLKSEDIPVKKISKPKKKEKCMVCSEMFSNLKTHSALHMDVEKRPFKCLFCSRGFARNNDLQRHQRKHLLEKNLMDVNSGLTKKKNTKNVCATDLGFKCPFYENKEDLQPFGSGHENIDEEDYVPKRCHSTGIFTRCDTFKNHLKALHFRYPKGTVRKNRANVSGFCKHCSMQFENCKIWADEHVLKGKCNNNRPFKNYMLVKTIPISGVDKNQNVLLVQQREDSPAVSVERVPTSASVLDLNNL
ncbi:Stp3 protein [Hanseniaspora uvarum]|nr:Stp3 protein [Hanseniaspora uvarum]